MRESTISKEEAFAKVAGKRQGTIHIKGYGDVTFVQPSRALYMRLMSQMQDDKVDSSAALLAFIKGCVVWPPSAEFDAIMDDYPGMMNKVGLGLQAMAEPEAEFVVKKG